MSRRRWHLTIGAVSMLPFLSGCFAEYPRSLVSPLYIAHVPTAQVSCEQANQNAYQIVFEYAARGRLESAEIGDY